ncbi:MAG: hypothetical protein WAO83_01100 [Fuerstiella sp.]
MPEKSEIKNSYSTTDFVWWAWAITLVVAASMEFSRLLLAVEQDGGLATWLTFWNMESSMPLLVLLAFPVLARIGRTRQATKIVAPSKVSATGSVRVWLAGIFVFSLSMLCSYRIGAEPISVKLAYSSTTIPFADLPPAYHDEYSYLLQARTFRNLRLSYPAAEVRPDLFHQFHVLNERRTVSRYFPTTGLWIAPFDALGNPIYGHWLAGALAAVFFYLAVLQLSRFKTAVLAGVLIAVSPGIAVFSNLLLAHHPTLLALSVFTWAFFRMMSAAQLRYAFIAGIALTFAMLARPMTAAGYGFPFGVWMASWLFRDRSSWRLIFGFVVPLVLGFVTLAVLNQDATGDWTKSAYQLYTDQFTPRHRFGFNNAVGVEPAKGPATLHAYDQWATNLTPLVAIQNVWNRLHASLQWSLAIVPLLFGLLMSLPIICGRGARRPVCADGDESKVGVNSVEVIGIRLLACSLVSLHLVHIPYWYDGIMHWHYVFETAPLILILAAIGFVRCVECSTATLSGKAAAAWAGCLILVGLVPGWFQLPVFDNVSKVSASINEQAFSKVRFEMFRQTVNRDLIQKPALVLVDERNTDPQLSYIINPPGLDGDVIVCRRPDTDGDIFSLKSAFSDRSIYVFTPSTSVFDRWEAGLTAPQ